MISQNTLYLSAKVAETMLLFVSFVNVLLIKVRQIRLIVTEIGALLKDFRTLQNTTDLGPSQIGHNQIKALVTQEFWSCQLLHIAVTLWGYKTLAIMPRVVRTGFRLQTRSLLSPTDCIVCRQAPLTRKAGR